MVVVPSIIHKVRRIGCHIVIAVGRWVGTDVIDDRGNRAVGNINESIAGYIRRVLVDQTAITVLSIERITKRSQVRTVDDVVKNGSRMLQTDGGVDCSTRWSGSAVTSGPRIRDDVVADHIAGIVGWGRTLQHDRSIRVLVVAGVVVIARIVIDRGMVRKIFDIDALCSRVGDCVVVDGNVVCGVGRVSRGANIKPVSVQTSI